MTSYVLRRLQCSLRQGKQIYELGLVPVRCGSRALCGFVLCVCLCREQPHLAPVSYGRPAAVHRQSENALGRLKVTVAQVCMCLHCNCVGFCVWVLPTPQDSYYVYTRYNSEPQLPRL